MPTMEALRSRFETTTPSLIYVVGGLLIALVTVVVRRSIVYSQSNIPLIGERWKTWFSFLSIMGAKELLEEGNRKYPNSIFRMPSFPHGSLVIVNGPKLIGELRNGADDTFSFPDAVKQGLQTKYTIGKEIEENSYHHPIIRTTLTRNLASLFPDIVDEMQASFKDVLGSSAEWRTIVPHGELMKIVCRTSNRVLVGAPLCRNEEFQKLNVESTVSVSKSAVKINMFPSFLHPIIGPLVSKKKEHKLAYTRILKGEIQRRKKCLEMYGSGWAEKPNDFMMWLIEEAPPGFEQTPEGIAIRIMTVNFAAIHTSSLTFTQALLHLAATPAWSVPLREEVEGIVREEGWTKASMGKMKKVDSFMRESSRINSIGLVTMNRYMLKPYTFSDGTRIPKGAYIAASSYSAHMDEAKYERAGEFDPWRHVNVKGKDEGKLQEQMVATSIDYLAFGLGKHACPGRFFAANELKAMLCYLIMNYDVKLPAGAGSKPGNEYIGHSVIPKRGAEIMIKRREGGGS